MGKNEKLSHASGQAGHLEGRMAKSYFCSCFMLDAFLEGLASRSCWDSKSYFTVGVAGVAFGALRLFWGGLEGFLIPFRYFGCPGHLELMLQPATMTYQERISCFWLSVFLEAWRVPAVA
jgi:hypothetical protein